MLWHRRAALRCALALDALAACHTLASLAASWQTLRAAQATGSGFLLALVHQRHGLSLWAHALCLAALAVCAWQWASPVPPGRRAAGENMLPGRQLWRLQRWNLVAAACACAGAPSAVALMAAAALIGAATRPAVQGGGGAASGADPFFPLAAGQKRDLGTAAF